MPIKKNHKPIIIYIIICIVIVVAFVICLWFFMSPAPQPLVKAVVPVQAPSSQVVLTPEEAARKSAIIASFENESPQVMTQAEINRKLSILKAIHTQ